PMNIWEEGLKLTQENISFVQVTILDVKGSAPQNVGAKIIVTKSGLHCGTVGGGKVEMAAIKKSQEMLDRATQSAPEVVTWNLQKDIGMTCGGEVQFLFEHFYQESWPIVI